MKRPVFFIAAALILLAGLPAFSQAQNYPKDAYIKSVHIEKVWTHELGYMVQFFNSKSHISSFYVPLTWFNKGINSKADIVYGGGRSFPYAAIYWVDGKFDHITINAHADQSGPTWGALNPSPELSAQFNVQEPPRDF